MAEQTLNDQELTKEFLVMCGKVGLEVAQERERLNRVLSIRKDLEILIEQGIVPADMKIGDSKQLEGRLSLALRRISTSQSLISPAPVVKRLGKKR